ncbi:MAG TPA: ABC transporter transmembrane domain-containing protein [Vicinamibacterales bacterium]|nr:ABC transporter transmembrane domain-containing protein [Vicinamibacterales bacterium]
MTLLSPLRRVGRLVWAERTAYLAGAIFVVFSTLAALVYPYVVRLILDDAIGGGKIQKLNQLVLMMVGILLVEAAATTGRDYFFGLGAERVGVRLRTLVFRTLLRQDIQFFDSRDVGEIATRLWADVPPLEHALGEELAETLKNVVLVVGGTALLFYTSARLTFLMMLGLPPIAFASSWLGRRVKSMAADVQTAHGEAGAAASEVLAGVRTVRAFAQESAERARFERQLARALDSAKRKVKARAALSGVSVLAGEFSALLAIWVGGNLIVQGRMTTGAMFSFILYALLVARGLRNSMRFGAEALRAIGSTQWAFALVEQTPRIPLEGGDRPSLFDGSIAFEQVRFRYPARPEVDTVKDIDLQIAPGEVVAVVGKSGSGKSTLLNLLLRFYDPDEGRVLIGGRDVRSLDASWLRAQIATVMQEPTLFSRGIAENIRYGVPDADEQAVRTAAEWASADEFISRLPGGLEATVGDRGVQLSGGQRQRLAIARALLQRPKILILDEATSALDAELESVVQSALRKIEYRPTTLVIAHRLSTVAHVDRVIVLDAGRIVESGTHEELIRTSRFYRQLVHTQLAGQP